jgi:uncharacterized BrkB/YihY/UPF0761 family membrane protein
VPGVLLLAGVAGIAIPDSAARSEAVAFVSGVLPPLHDLIETVLTEATRDAGPITILGLVALAWGASRFVVAFQDALRRVSGGGRQAGFVRTNAVAVAAVLLLVAAVVVGALVGGLLALLEAAVATSGIVVVGDVIRLLLGFLGPVITCVAMVGVYRILLLPRPTWRAAAGPGLVVGLILTILGRVFVFLAPRLIGAAALLGTLAVVFAALAWLALSFQAVLFGAAWLAQPADEPEVPPTLAGPAGVGP